MSDAEDFARRIEECAKRREPVTLFGVDYVASDENHRLREVVRALLVCDDDDADAHGCPMYDEHAEDRCRLDAALVELGIEVDG